jgi:hypothetical protein
LLTSGAHAQVGLFFNPIVTRASNSQADGGPFAFLGQGNTSAIFGGLSIGGNYTFIHGEKYDVAGEFRDEIEHGHSALLNSAMVGARIKGHLNRSAFKPYLQGMVGGGLTHSQHSPVRADKAMFKVYAGADYAISKHVDFRAIEIGYGSLTTINSGLYGGSPQPAVNLLSFSTGFVFRIPIKGHN